MDKVQKIREEVVRMHNLLPVMDGDNISVNYADRICTTLEMYIDSLQEEPVSEELEEASRNYADDEEYGDDVYFAIKAAFKAGAKWQEKQDQKTIELAEDHAYFAGRTKTMDKINEALLSEVLPCFMQGGEADEVVAKLDEVLNQDK